MCAAPNGSHFTSAGHTGSAHLRPGTTQPSTHSTSGGTSAGMANASDTFADMPAVTGFGNYTPNGSDSSPMRPVYSAGPAGETEEFLAIAGAAGQDQPQQPQLTPSEQPVSAPANPLVAAKMANSGQAKAGSGLFPIQGTDSERGTKEFDTTFNEPRSKKSGVIVAIVIVLVVAVFAAAYIYLTNKEAAQARTQLDAAIETLASTDAVISSIDGAVAEEISTGVAPEALSLALEQSTTTQNSLSSAETQANDALASSARMTSEQKSAADAVLESISARRSMLEAARQIQTATGSVSAATEALNQVFDLINEANSKYSYANELWTAYTGGGDISWLNPQDILDNEAEAYNDVQNALQIVASAKESAPDVDFTAVENDLNCYADLLNARYTHNSFAIAGDTASADAQMDWFNTATANLDAAAAQMFWSTDEYLAAYGPADTSVDAFVSNYAYARDKLVVADTAIAAYAGTTPAVSGALPEAAGADNGDEAVPAEGEGDASADASAEAAASADGEVSAEESSADEEQVTAEADAAQQAAAEGEQAA